MLHQSKGVSKVQPTQNGAPGGTSPKRKEMKQINVWMGSTMLQGVYILSGSLEKNNGHVHPKESN